VNEGDSSVRIATGTGWTAGVRFPAEAKDFPLFHGVQAGFGSHPASYAMDTEAVSLGVKRPGCEAQHSPPSSVEVKNGGAIPAPPFIFMAWCLIKYMEFTFYLLLLLSREGCVRDL
jgi:hypothetical protein